MIILLVLILLIVIPALYQHKYTIEYEKSRHNKENIFDKMPDLETFNIMSIIIASVLLFVALVIFLIPAYIGVDYQIQADKLERQSIVKEMELIDSEMEDISKQKVYEDVRNYNNKVLSMKALSSNYFTNVFVSKRYADSLEIIEIK